MGNFTHPLCRLVLLVAVLGLLACQDSPSDSTVATPAASPPSAVTALGRLEPGFGVVDVGLPLGDRVARLEVTEGESVTAEQVLAVLESFDERQAEQQSRQARVEEAQQMLRRSLDIMPSAIAARQADVRRLEADVELARSDLRRTESLVRDAVLPARELDYQRAVEAQARETLEHAKAVLDQERRERRLAITAARAALRTAEAELATAQARLEQTMIRAPLDGSVLDILRFPGESTQEGPLLRLGEVQHMVAVAELYESDARFVTVGQSATVTSPALAEVLHGRVALISQLVHKNDVLGIDPVTDTDSRVIEARIELDRSDLAARFVHLQVDVEIQVDVDIRVGEGTEPEDTAAAAMP